MPEYLFYAIIGILAVICIVLGIKNHRYKSDTLNLSESIDDFINNGEVTPFSLYDNDFAKLQNGITDLEEIINLERNKLKKENEKSIQFISDISHQLKTPIAAMKLYCEMDNELSPTEHGQKELELVGKMEKLVYQLMRLEKIKTDPFGEDFTVCSLNDIANEVVGVFSTLFPSREFIVRGDSKLRCNKSWMIEAIGNVVKNACEHTDDNGRIVISVSDTERSAIVEISDNGGGVKDVDMQNLFVRFYKAENSSQSSTGIGLAITKAVVERHHGVISLENKNGGLCVSFCMPHINANEVI